MSDIYISVDVEATGQTPGLYSMISLGAVVVEKGFEKTFYREIKPLATGMVDKEAMEVNKLNIDYLKMHGESPIRAMNDLVDWVDTVKEESRPVFASFGTFDWMFVRYYLEQFSKQPRLFGPNGFDIKSYAAGVLGKGYRGAAKAKLPKMITGGFVHTHHALDDAIEQGTILLRLMEYREMMVMQISGKTSFSV